MVSKTQYGESEVEHALLRLQKSSFVLRTIGLAIPILTLCSIILSLIRRMAILEVSPLVIIIPASISLLLIIFHDDQRKRGKVIYREITDELHWNEDLPIESFGTNSPNTRLDLAGRITVSSFVQGSELPLMPGRVGYVVYALIELALLVAMYLRYL